MLDRLIIVGKTLAAGGLLFLAGSAFEHAQISYLRENDPATAYVAQPDDALAIAGTLAQRLGENPQFQPSAIDLANLRNALRRQPLEPNLLAFQALYFDNQGQTARAAAIMRAANAISRRSILAELWLIEDASASNDVKAALQHYHAVLSVHPEMHGALLPVLVSATAFPEVRSALRPYLQMGTKWTSPFLELAATKAAPSDLLPLLQPLPEGLASDGNRGALAKFVKRLAMEVGPDATAGFASAIIPDFDRTSLTTFAITPQTRDLRLGSLAWVFSEADGIAVDAHDRGEIKAVIAPLARGVLASRELMVTANTTYVLRQRVTFGGETGNAQLTWKAACLLPDRTQGFWEQKIPSSAASMTYQMNLTVPRGCHLIRLTASVSGPDGQMPSEITLMPLTLEAFKGSVQPDATTNSGAMQDPLR